jgi:nickel/cobalt transporter (NiCoT) family protein
MRSLLNDAPGNVRARILGIYGILLMFNAGAWLWAIVAFRHYPSLLGTAFLAYSFGLRHAVDADHIASIDNVTRKLMQEGKRPVAVGFMFSLGHSTIVVIGSIAIASTALALQHRMNAFRSIFGIHVDFLRCVQGDFFLRKKPLECPASICSNSENAISLARRR